MNDAESSPAVLGSDLTRYRAPALEKGLDILELLVAEAQPLTVSEIAQRLNRSTGELFRMIQVLHRRGFVEQSPGTGAYRLSGKLFALGMDQPAVKTLVEIALPHMRQLSLDIGQSCHLAFHSLGQIVVVARMESSELIGYSVRIGWRRPLTNALSGAILFAFQPEVIRRRWEECLRPRPDEEELATFRAKADRIRKKGFGQQKSDFVVSVTDISAPILRDDIAAAALTVPFLNSTSPSRSMQDSIEHLIRAARLISSGLLSSDQRA
ncbi:MAG: IclR family transcriptional regulator [Pseudomonadota bacterium]|nr:IclR family transcriptional regulator [Pseudomonadota bacterium]